MKIVLMPLTFLLIIGLWVFIKSRTMHKQQQQTIREGLTLIRSLRQLLEHIPQHRGMANALLSGDLSFRDKAKQLQATINGDFVETNALLNSDNIDSPLFNHWCEIKQDWQRLQKTVDQMSAANSFESHSNLITKIIYLISDICDDKEISSHPDRHIRSIADTAFNQLPEIIELCGQARGIGTGAVVKGSLATATRIKLEFLHQRLQSIQKTVDHKIRANNMDKKNHPLISTEATKASTSQTEKFIRIIQDRLLATEKITIAANDYFETGSHAIESNLKILDSIINLIDSNRK